MEAQGVMIREMETQKHFGFVREFPCVCAQGNSEKEVINKINKNWTIFINKMNKYKTYYKKYPRIGGWIYCVL